MAKKTKTALAVGIIILSLAGFAFLFSKRLAQKETSIQNVPASSKKEAEKDYFEDSFSNSLVPKDSHVTVSEKRTEKTIGPAGGVIETSYGGVTYTLTVPPEVLPIRYDISLAPLLENPLSGYEREDFGQGVLIEPESSMFGVSAFLTARKEEVAAESEVAWGYCNIGSRGYDPEICLWKEGVSFNFGVDEGKVALQAKPRQSLSLLQTVPSQNPDVINARIWGGGAFLFDRVNETELEQIASSDLYHASDFSSEVEPFAHLAAFGADLSRHKNKINQFRRSHSSFPRSILEGAIVAAAAGEMAVGREKLDEFFSEYEKNFVSIRSSYLPWMSYYSTLDQLEKMLEGADGYNLSFIPRALAKSKKPGLKEGQENIMALDSETYNKVLRQKQDAVNRARENLNNESLSATERLGAIEIIETQRSATEEDRKKAAEVLELAAEQFTTMAEGEKIADMAREKHNSVAEYKALGKMKRILEVYESCENQTTKNLSNFGMNDCP